MGNSIKKPLWLKLTIIFLCVVLGLCALVGGMIAYFRLSVKEYYNNSTPVFNIPALSKGLVPQGFAYDEDNKWFITCGYMNDGSASSVYAVDRLTNKTVKGVKLYTDENTPFTGHCGGVAIYKNYIYIAGGSDCCIYVFDYAKLKTAKDGDKILLLGKVETKSQNDNIRPSFVTVKGSRLYVGEFYRQSNYPTLDSHHLQTPNGDFNNALIVEFALSNLSYKDTYGINIAPKNAYSIPEKVQGMAIEDDRMYLSTSWGLGFSKILVYDIYKGSTEKKTIFDTDDITVYYMDNKNLVQTIKAPPMSEEMVILNKKLYIMNESACNKYIFGKFTDGKWCYATDLTKYGL